MNGTKGKTAPQFNETSLQKARSILNDMMFTAWQDLDDIIFECKTFQDRNRGTYNQVTSDQNRIGAELASLEKTKVVAMKGKVAQTKQRRAIKKNIGTLDTDYKKTKQS